MDNQKKVTDPRSFRDNIVPNDYRMTPPFQKEPEDMKNWIEAAPSFNDEYVLETFSKKAVDYISKYSKEEKPLFLYLPLTSPHLPHCTHPDFREKSNCGNYGDFMQETDFRIGQVIGPSNLKDVPVALQIGDGEYWMFGRYAENESQRNGTF